VVVKPEQIIELLTEAFTVIGGSGVIDPVVTPPGDIQLEDVPVNAKFVSVPVFELPEKSVKLVMPVFAAPATPWLKW